MQIRGCGCASVSSIIYVITSAVKGELEFPKEENVLLKRILA